MNLHDLIHKYIFAEVDRVLCELYPDIGSDPIIIFDYAEVYNELLALEPVGNATVIVIEEVEDEVADDGVYTDVFGIIDTVEDFDTRYALDFTPWQEWLGMDIAAETLSAYTETEIIAHCLWEMTFMGFTQEIIQAKLNTIKSDIEAYKLGDIHKTFEWPEEWEDEL